MITFTGNSNISLVEGLENPVDRIWNYATGRPAHSPYQAYVLPEKFSGEYVGLLQLQHSFKVFWVKECKETAALSC